MSKARKILFPLFIMCCCFTTLQGQNFDFSFHAAFLAGQVDGDNLRGFNKPGYRLGIEGSYKISAFHQIIVSQGISRFGSGAVNASINKQGDYFIELSLLSANIIFAYAYHFQSGWEGESNFKLAGGIALHHFLIKEPSLSYYTFAEEPPVRINPIKERYLSLYLAAGRQVGKSVYLDLALEHALQNIMHPNADGSGKNLHPYHLMLGIHYYL